MKETPKKRSRLFDFMTHPALAGVMGAAGGAWGATRSRAAKELLRDLATDEGARAVRAAKLKLRGAGGLAGGAATALMMHQLRKRLRKDK